MDWSSGMWGEQLEVEEVGWVLKSYISSCLTGVLISQVSLPCPGPGTNFNHRLKAQAGTNVWIPVPMDNEGSGEDPKLVVRLWVAFGCDEGTLLQHAYDL